MKKEVCSLINENKYFFLSKLQTGHKKQIDSFFAINKRGGEKEKKKIMKMCNIRSLKAYFRKPALVFCQLTLF